MPPAHHCPNCYSFPHQEVEVTAGSPIAQDKCAYVGAEQPLWQREAYCASCSLVNINICCLTLWGVQGSLLLSHMLCIPTVSREQLAQSNLVLWRIMLELVLALALHIFKIIAAWKWLFSSYSPWVINKTPKISTILERFVVVVYFEFCVCFCLVCLFFSSIWKWRNQKQFNFRRWFSALILDKYQHPKHLMNFILHNETF